jgi:hypothetical protein
VRTLETVAPLLVIIVISICVGFLPVGMLLHCAALESLVADQASATAIMVSDLVAKLSQIASTLPCRRD